MAGGTRRTSVPWGGALFLVAALASAAMAANADPSNVGSTNAKEGASVIRLKVPTSIAFDPLSETSGVDTSAVEAGPSEAPWTDLQDFPTPVFDDRIGLSYTLGGNDGTQVSDAMISYRDDLDDWSNGVRLPRPRQAPAIATNKWGGEMVMAGGWDATGEPTATTHYYDDASEEWVYEWDEMPAARAAAGYASFSDHGDLYVIGGCTTSGCNPVADSVFAFDWWGEWSAVADYPVPVAFPSCGAWKERIYCTGGHDGTGGIADSYVYDRRTDDWSPLPAPPSDSWGAQHAMLDGILVVNGGVQGGAVTNNTFGYDVRAGVWVDLPNSNAAKYRGAGGCATIGNEGHQFISVGGLNGTDVPVAQVEALPGFRTCGDGFGVPDVSRYAGSNRYGTAAEIAELYQEPQATVFVTTGEDFPDALAAAARAGSLKAPILLTRSDSLPEETRAALERMAPQSVIVVGGSASVSEDVVGLIGGASGADVVRRLAGSNRYETAATIAAEIDTADTVFIATGLTFPDALAGAARAGALDAPLLLVKPNQLPAPTLAQLDRLLPENIVVLGGNASVSDSVVTQLGEYGAVARIAGADRWQTAALIAAEYPQAESMGVASGRTWADALTGSARAGGIEAPIMLVDTDRIPAPGWAASRRLGPDVIEVYGGTGAVSEGVFKVLKTLYD